jgi:hypothetical protein
MQPQRLLSRQTAFDVLCFAVRRSGRYRRAVVVFVLRIVYGLWFLGTLALLLLTVADMLFGRLPFADRLRALPLRLILAVLWPLALITRRGREVLFSQWRNVL